MKKLLYIECIFLMLFGKVVEVVRLLRSHKILEGPQFEPFSPQA